VSCGRGVAWTSTTIRRRGGGDSAATPLERVGCAVGTGPGVRGTTIWEDFSTRTREGRVPFAINTGTEGVTVGGMFGGVGTFSATAGTGAAGAGSSAGETRAGPRRPKRPAA